MSRIVVVGSARVDLVAHIPSIQEHGETVSNTEFVQVVGGKGANQAMAAARLGAEVTFIARVGQDAHGIACLESYAQSGVDTSAVQTTPGISTGFKRISMAANGESSVKVIPGANAQLTPQDVRNYAEVIQKADVLLVQMEIPMETITQAVELAAQHGIKIILNSVSFRTMPRTLLEKITVLTLNALETQHLLGTVVYADEQMAKEILGQGPQSVIITQDSEGALVVGSWGYVRIPGFPSQPRDITGAEDAFNAGLAVALGEGLALDQAARFASAAAVIAVSRIGAQPSTPTRSEVEVLLQSA